MRLLFALVHPAHVHLFRNLIGRARAQGWETLAATREKDVTVELCRAYDIPQAVLSRAGSGALLRGGRELLVRTARLHGLARDFRPHALLGSSMSIGTVGRLIGRPSFVFSEDDAAAVPLFARIAYPSASRIVTPSWLSFERHGRKHLTYRGFQKLAYLHPAHFRPDPAVPARLGLDPTRPYFVVRLVALRAHHDRGARGLDADRAMTVVERLAARGPVVVSAEGELHPDLEPHRFRSPAETLPDVLAHAALYVGDSQSMTVEAAVLGVPNLRSNTFVGRLSCFDELQRFGLCRGFRPEAHESLLRTLDDWLGRLDEVRQAFSAGRRNMLAECVDLADWQWEMLLREVRCRRFSDLDQRSPARDRTK